MITGNINVAQQGSAPIGNVTLTGLNVVVGNVSVTTIAANINSVTLNGTAWSTSNIFITTNIYVSGSINSVLLGVSLIPSCPYF
jgi:hypothetical protein